MRILLEPNSSAISPDNGEVTVSDEEIRELRLMIAFAVLLFSCAFGVQGLSFAYRNGLIQCCEFRKRIILQALEITKWSLFWYAFSITLILYNKWILNSWEGGFPFPITISMVHMVVKLCLAAVFVKANCKTQATEENRNGVAKLGFTTWICAAVPVGITTALDVAASNASYLYVSIPFYTVVKSSTILFVLFFSILYRLQPFKLSLIAVATLISGGVALAVYGEKAEFSLLGLGLVLGASCVGGYRWALTQLLMLKMGEKLSPVHTIYYISPAAAVTLIPFCIWLESEALFNSKFVHNFPLLVSAILNILGAGVFAFAMILVELQLIKQTSSLSLAAVSYVKQFLQIFVAVIVFGAVITWLNIFGMVLTTIGLFLYTYMKAQEAEKCDPNIEKPRNSVDDQREDLIERDSLTPLSTTEEGSKEASKLTYARNGYASIQRNGSSIGSKEIDADDELTII
mmetsp:Transcript_15059/g.17042  ORF Transcript_15059/g.17042 Transcript_15059/m.17042 type:complete len:459 (-) Transcript_15059:131-1507(-)